VKEGKNSEKPRKTRDRRTLETLNFQPSLAEFQEEAGQNKPKPLPNGMQDNSVSKQQLSGEFSVASPQEKVGIVSTGQKMMAGIKLLGRGKD